MNKSKILAALGALTLTAVGCAPLPPCPTTPEKTPAVASADGLSDKGDGGENVGRSSQKAKSGESRGADSIQQKELTQQSKAEFQSPNQPPLPPACKPAS
jgi:hypothetical protein